MEKVVSEAESAEAAERARAELPGRFSHAWRALRHRNFKPFFSGQSISLIGTWMTLICLDYRR
jgi:hypothetical protein